MAEDKKGPSKDTGFSSVTAAQRSNSGLLLPNVLPEMYQPLLDSLPHPGFLRACDPKSPLLDGLLSTPHDLSGKNSSVIFSFGASAELGLVVMAAFMGSK